MSQELLLLITKMSGDYLQAELLWNKYFTEMISSPNKSCVTDVYNKWAAEYEMVIIFILYLGREKKCWVSTNPTNPIFAKSWIFFFYISDEKEPLQTWIITSHYLESMTVDHNNIVTPYSLQLDLAYTMRLKGAPSNFSRDFSLLYNSLIFIMVHREGEIAILGEPY